MSVLSDVYSVEGGLLLHSRRSCPAIRTELPYRDGSGAPIRVSRVTSLPAPSRRCRVCWEAAVGASAVESVDTTRTLTVEIDATRVATIRDVALQRHGEMAGRDLSYGVTSPERQLTGLLGEAAVLLWLTQELAGAFEFAGDQPGGADVYLRSKLDGQGWTMLEVKTHDAAFWYEHGRLVNTRQLARMSADVIVWCVVPKRPERFALERDLRPGSETAIDVVVAGWSPVEECRASGTDERSVKWSNVRVHAPLRAPGALVDWLRGGRREGWDRA